MQSIPRQGGVALVAILLVVAIGTVMAASMVVEQQATIQTTRGFLSRGQAQQYALGGEELARQILRADAEEATGIDYLLEAWADPELHYEFEEGEVHLQITDLQGLFNVNQLSEENPEQGIARQRLNNMLAAVNADPTIADRIQDWIDTDTSARVTGAEDFEYLVFDPPYRTGNVIVADVSELALTGLEPEIYHALWPYLTALPESRTKINVNTASAPVLQSLAPGLTPELAEALAARRADAEGFETVQIFLQQPELAGLGVLAQGLGVQSAFFEIRVIARYRDRFSYLTSVLHRNTLDGSMRILQRDFSRTFRAHSADTEAEDRG